MPTEESEGARRSIIDSTRRLLEQRDSADLGLSRIAADAGYSRQTVYRQFGSRAGLLKAVLADIDERAGAQAAVGEVLAVGDAVAVLDALVEWWAEYVAGFVGVSRSVLAGRASDPALAAAWDDRMEALLGVCRLVAERCKSEGALRPGLSVQAASEMLWGLLSIPLWDQLNNDLGWSRSEYTERVGLIARSALLAG